MEVMDYDLERESLYANRRKIGEATENIEVGEGETVSPTSVRRKEEAQEEEIVEVALDTIFQFVEVIIDLAESLKRIANMHGTEEP